MSKSEDGETCVCDNGSGEEDCFLEGDDPWEDCDPDYEEECVPCNPDFEDCAPGGGGDDGGDWGEGDEPLSEFPYDHQDQATRCEVDGRCVLESFDDDQQTFQAISDRIRSFGPECYDIADTWDYVWTRDDDNVQWYTETVGDSTALNRGHVHRELPWTPIHMFRGNDEFPGTLDHWTTTAVHEVLHVILDDGRHPPELGDRVRQCSPNSKYLP